MVTRDISINPPTKTPPLFCDIFSDISKHNVIPLRREAPEILLSYMLTFSFFFFIIDFYHMPSKNQKVGTISKKKVQYLNRQNNSRFFCREIDQKKTHRKKTGELFWRNLFC